MSELRSSVAESFSLTLGGPFYRLQVKFGHAQMSVREFSIGHWLR